MKTRLLTILMMLAMLAGASVAKADTVTATATFDSSVWGTTDKSFNGSATDTWTSSGVTMAITGDNTYNSSISSGYFYVYYPGNLTFTVPTGCTLTGLTITGSGDAVSASTGTMTANATSGGYTWSGSASTLTLTPGTSGRDYYRFESIVVTYEADLDVLATTTSDGAEYRFHRNATPYVDASLHAKTITAGIQEMYFDGFSASTDPMIVESPTGSGTYLHMPAGSRLRLQRSESGSGVYVTRASFTYVSGTPNVEADGGEYDSSTGVWTGRESQVIFLFNDDADIQLVQAEAAAYASVRVSTQGRGQTAVDGTNIDLESDPNGNPTGTTTVYVAVGGSLALTMTPDDARHELSTASYTESYWDAEDNYHSDDTDFLSDAKANGSYTISNIQHDCSVSIVYSWITHLISYHASGNGTINLVATYLDDDGTSTTYDQAEQMYGGEAARDNTDDRKISIGTGGTVNMIMTADTGYKLSSLLVNDVEMVNSENLSQSGNVYTYTINPLTAAQTISATFVKALTDGDTFTALTAEGLEMTFKIISVANKTCQAGDGSHACVATDLTAVTVPSVVNDYNVIAIGDMAFKQCYSMASVTIPATVTSIGEEAFHTCNALTSIELPSTLTTISASTFRSSGLTSITIPEGVTSIGNYAFSGCDRLATVNFPSTLQSIGDNAFSLCSALTAINLPTGITTVGSSAFQNCEAVTSITIPASLTNIGEFAFGINNLKYVTAMATTPASISENSFGGYANATLYVPSGYEGVYEQATGWSQFSHIFAIGKHPYAVLSGNTLKFYCDDQKDTREGMDVGPFTGGNDNAWYGIKDDIYSVEFDASFADYTRLTSTCSWFYSCGNLTSVSGLQYVNTSNVTDMSYMFLGCGSLTGLDLGNFNTANVTNMRQMFQQCSSLKIIRVGSLWSTENVENSYAMFGGCTSLVGGVGTAYSSDHEDATYAHIDGGTDNPGYLTDVDAPGFFNINVKVVGLGNVTATYSSNQTYIYSNSDNDISVARGESATLTITPDTDYKLSSVEMDGTAVDVTTSAEGVITYTTPNVYAEHSIIVTFVSNTPEAYARLTEDQSGNVVLTFYYDTNKEDSDYSVGPFASSTDRGWHSVDTEIKTVVFDESFANYRPVSTAYWFEHLSMLTAIEGIGNLSTANVTDMSGMFEGCVSLTSLVLSGFNTASVTSMLTMFDSCSGLTSLDLRSFDTSNVLDMGNMFAHCSGLTSLDVSSFNTANVTSMRNMFYECSSLTAIDISSFNTAKVTNMEGMFTNCYALTTIYAGSEWSTENVTESTNMFYSSTSIKGGRGTMYSFDGTHLDHIYARIDGGPDSETPGYFTDINAATEFDVLVTVEGNGSVSIGNGTIAGGSEEHITMPAGGTMTMTITPGEGYALGSLMLDTLNVTSQVSTSVEGVMTYTLSSIYDTHNITVTFVNDTDEPYAVLAENTLTFYYDKQKESRGGIDINNSLIDTDSSSPYGTATTASFDTSFANYSPTSTAYWFHKCSSLTAIHGLEYLNTANVTNMDQMFAGCSSLTSLDVSSFDTSKVTDMGGMFNICSSLTSLDMTGFNTQNVTVMTAMFNGCNSLTSLDVSNFKTDNVTDMSWMFSYCSNLTMLDLSNFVTSATSNMAYMFYGCTNLSTIYGGDGWVWLTISSGDSENMFGGCSSLVGGKGTAYDENYTNYTRAQIDGGTSNPGYFTDKNAATTFDVLVTVVGNGSVSISSATIAGGTAEHITMPAGGTMTLNITPDTGYAFSSLMLDTLDVTSQVSADSTGVLTYTLSRIYDTHTVTVTFVNDTDEPYAVLADNTLTFYYDKQRESRGGTVVGADMGISGISNASAGETVTSVVFDQSMANCTTITNTASWFSNFTQLSRITGLEYLNTSNVATMNNMFYNCLQLSGIDLSHFDTGRVTDMGGMFMQCSSLTTLDLTSFSTDAVTNMIAMFMDCSNLETITVGQGWTTSSLEMSSSMFSGCTSLKGSKGTTYDAEYTDATYAHIDEGESNPGYLTDINAATEYDVLVTVVGNGSVSIGSATIAGGTAEHITMPAGGTMTLNITPDTGYAFSGLMLDTLDVTSQVAADSTGVLTYTLSRIYDPHSITVTFVNNTPEAYAVLDGNTLTFYYDTEKESRQGMDVGPFTSEENRGWNDNASSITAVVFDDSFANETTITSTANWFYGMSNLTNIEGLSYLNTQNVTSMGWMFQGCSSLTSLDISGFNTQNVTGMYGMFWACSSLTSLDLSGFNTQNVTNMWGMFYGCTRLTSLDVSSFNTQNVTDMSYMFPGCSHLTSLDVSGFNTQNVTNMGEMFRGCSDLTTIYVGSEWSTSSVTNSTDMFANCTSLVGGRGTAYDADHTDATYARIDMAPNAPGYFTRKDQQMGDANDDGSVTIADAVATVTNILNEATNEYFSQTKADMNGDSTIDIFDVTLIVNAVLSASPAPAYNGGDIAAEDVRMEASANSLTMGINGSAEYTAFQFDVTLPEGTTLEGVRLANKATNHQLVFKKVGDNTYRVVGLSMTNQQLSAVGGRLVQMQLSGHADESNVTMSNVLFVGQPATDATAIRNHVADGAADRGAIYDLNGRYVGNDRRQLSKGIYIINHKKVNIK